MASRSGKPRFSPISQHHPKQQQQQTTTATTVNPEGGHIEAEVQVVNCTRDDVSPGGGVRLEQRITLLNGVTVIVGSIVGSGIFISPRGVLAGTGSVGLSLVVWVLSGLYSMVGAYCYAELGTAIVRSGADYAYILEAFGPALGFMRLWIESFIVRPCTTAIVALTFAYYVIEPLFPDCDQPEIAVTLLAAVCIRKSTP